MIQFDTFNGRQDRDLAVSRKCCAVNSGGNSRIASRHRCDLARIADRCNSVIGRSVADGNVCRIVWRNRGFQRGGFACRQRQRFRCGNVSRRDNDLNRFTGGDFTVLAG